MMDTNKIRGIYPYHEKSNVRVTFNVDCSYFDYKKFHLVTENNIFTIHMTFYDGVKKEVVILTSINVPRTDFSDRKIEIVKSETDLINMWKELILKRNLEGIITSIRDVNILLSRAEVLKCDITHIVKHIKYHI